MSHTIALFQEHSQHRGHQLQNRNTMLNASGYQIVTILMPVLSSKHDLSASKQRSVELPDGGIEAESGFLQHAIRCGQWKIGLHPAHMVVQGAVRDHYPFGFAGRA